MSPTRLEVLVSMIDSTPTQVDSGRTSPGFSISSPARARTSAWRKLSGPPSSRTARRPRAILPSVRPRFSHSITSG